MDDSTRHYVRGNILPFEEDAEHEFKGHRNLAVEDLPPHAKATKTKRASRKASSRAINAFLNNGKGGTVFLGVTDMGEIRGIKLTHYQKEHILDSMKDLMSRYNPPVPPHRYQINFVRMVEPDTSKETLSKLLAYSTEPTEERPTNEPHRLRTSQMCWCDSDATAQYSSGVMFIDYIVEIVIKPWDPDDPRNCNVVGSIVRLHPFHKDEEGNIYFRRQASLARYGATEVGRITQEEIRSKCLEEISRLKQAIREEEERILAEELGDDWREHAFNQ